jgi:hypothetical protein
VVLLSFGMELFLIEFYIFKMISLSVKFTSNLTDETWILTNIYGPCQANKKEMFLIGYVILICRMTLTILSWMIST